MRHCLKLNRQAKDVETDPVGETLFRETIEDMVYTANNSECLVNNKLHLYISK